MEASATRQMRRTAYAAMNMLCVVQKTEGEKLPACKPVTGWSSRVMTASGLESDTRLA